ncbi:MAG: AbrB/MazE/SpoVT family DNA-binding domain-containing protein [Anaerolineae bacterium]
MDSEAVLRDRGVLTLPKDVRERNDFEPGTRFQVIDIGQGTIVLARQASVLAELADELSRALEAADVSLDDLLEAARQERQRLHQQRHAAD